MNRIALLVMTVLMFGCGKIREGIKAFYEGDFDRSERLLRKAAHKAATREPVVRLKLEDGRPIEKALRSATQDGFAAWQAYSGSLLGLQRPEESCRNIALAMRPIQVYVNDKPLAERVDPREGDFWQHEVMTLRGWWLNIPCE